jgi:L-alanine-DL-glutamate epimerase-like enolase superfamily enzyme
MNIRYRIIQLPFHYPFTISKGTKTHQRIFQVELEWRGIRGYGEAPEIAYYNIPAAAMQSDLQNKLKFVENFALTTPDRFWHFLHHLFPFNPFLVCALDIAAWDLYGKLMRKPLYQLFSADPSRMPVTDYTIGIAESQVMIQKMIDNPWPVYKIKVGTAGDIERLRQLRIHTNAILRVDANAGWSMEDAERNLSDLNEMGIELVEQPLAKDDWEGMKKLKAISPLPLFADESCVKESDVIKCSEGFDGINIKLTKCSGITPARRMITEARSLGLKIMIGCMNESAIGTAAIAHLGPLVDYLDADGPLLLKEDPVEGLKYDDAKLQLVSVPGLGISVDPFN